MGFLGLVKFALKCFDVLAWPLLGLVYPLCASVKAIESDFLCTAECKKVVAYWVVFSLILLFEHSFQILLLQWLPLWPYMKLILTCCLAIPRFEGAFYVYKCLVSVDMEQLLVDMLNGWKDLHSNIEADVQVNGFEACKELVSTEASLAETDQSNLDDVQVNGFEACKELVSTDASLAETDKSNVQVNGFEARKELVSTEASLAKTDKSNLDAEEIKEISEKVEEAGGGLSEIEVSDQVQKEWTCGLCLVTTQSEITLNSHLRGRRHQAACDELKPKNQQSESIDASKQRRKILKLKGLRKKYVEYIEPLWWCKLCKISCNSIHDIDCHLYGKNHLTLTREFNASAAAKS